MSEIKLPAASGGGSISIKGPASSGSDVDLLDTSGNLTVSGDIDLADSKKVKLGDSEDIQIFHDGTVNRFLLDGETYFNNKANSECFIITKTNGAVELYYDLHQ